MAVNGLRKFSLIDYPGKVCCVVFMGHCNFRCPFCHNPALVFDPESQGEITQLELLDFWEHRRNHLDAVVFSGGEPTLAPELPLLAQSAKAKGFLVRIDTNGSNLEVLQKIHHSGALDSLGIDYKAPLAKYSSMCNITPQTARQIHQTITWALTHQIELEIRTTVHKSLLSEADLQTMLEELNTLKVSKWVLQQFHLAEVIEDSLLQEPTYSDGELKKIAANLGTNVYVRGTQY